MTARVPDIDWSKGFEPHWNGGDPVASHLFNALSFLFPRGERFFIDQAREVAAQAGLERDPQFEPALREFVAQESIHAHQHGKYNDRLRELGYENVSDELAQRLEREAYERLSPLARLAVVCAYEHYTAALGHFILANPQVLRQAPADMRLVWGWHSVEETEHKAVCFDLYRRAGGRYRRRVVVFFFVTMNFTRFFWRLYLHLLRRDGCLAPRSLPRTLARMARIFAGPAGVGWHMLGAILRYLNPWFHPWLQDNRGEMQQWLAANEGRLRPVKG